MFVEAKDSSIVRTRKTYCECQRGRLHSPFVASDADILAKFLDETRVLISEECIEKNGLRKEDTPIPDSGLPGYVVCETTRKPVF